MRIRLIRTSNRSLAGSLNPTRIVVSAVFFCALILGGCGTWATRTGAGVDEAINSQERKEDPKHDKYYYQDLGGSSLVGSTNKKDPGDADNMEEPLRDAEGDEEP